MRSKLGTKSRLAAHILALVLLIFMLVYTAPESRAPDEPPPRRRTPSVSLYPEKPAAEAAAPRGVGTLDKVHTPAVATRVEAQALRPPGGDGAARREAPEQPKPGIAAEEPARTATIDNAVPLQPHTEPLRPPEAAAAETAEDPVATDAPAAPAATDEKAAAEVSVEDTPAAGEIPAGGESAAMPSPDVNAGAAAGEAADTGEAAESGEADAAAPIPAADAEPVADVETDTGVEPAAGADPAADAAPVQPETAQPDESGALVVAAVETGAVMPVAAATPLPNATLEVLGDGVYWIDPRRDLKRELAAVPELRRLVLLAPLPGYRPPEPEFAHVKTEVIPADPADLTRDAADRFLHFTGGDDTPAVVAVLPGTRGAAFFKGAYLLKNRAMSVEEVLREIAPELDDAGEAKDDIVHRLMRFAN